MNRTYILDGHQTIPCDMATWALWFTKADRIVAVTKQNDITVSTVFLGLDHSFGSGRPLLFETLVFGGKHDGDMERYSTWEEAEIGHKQMCEKIFDGK